MLCLDGVSVAFDGVRVVDRVSLELPRGDVLAVLGPSGCGKTTLLRAIAGLAPLAAGRVSLDGRDLRGTPTHKRGFAVLFQDGQLFAHMSVARNIGYALALRRQARSQITARVSELLELVGLAGYEDRAPASLSGGEAQRVALARALAGEPRLLLLDEPLSALDTTLRERLAVDLARILRESGTTALMVTHDHDEAFTVADQIAVMRAGEVVQAGPIEAVWAEPVDAQTAIFLGYARVLVGSAAAQVLAASQFAHADTATSSDGPAELRVALRRSALHVDPAGALSARVESVRSTPTLTRLTVVVEGIGEVDAVAPLDSLLGPGQRVTLRVDHTRLAVVADEPLGQRRDE